MHRPPWSPAHHEGPPPRGRPRLRATRRSHADARLRADARGRDGGVRQKAGGGSSAVRADRQRSKQPASCPPNVKTAGSWRGIVPFTHLAREGRMTVTIGRRELLVALGGAAAAWPLAAAAQQPAMRRIGVLLPAAADNTQYQTWVGAFLQGLAQSGWNIGQNVRIDTRWATANADAVRRHAAELAALAPDVILAPGASTVGPLLQV